MMLDPRFEQRKGSVTADKFKNTVYYVTLAIH